MPNIFSFLKMLQHVTSLYRQGLGDGMEEEAEEEPEEEHGKVKDETTDEREDESPQPSDGKSRRVRWCEEDSVHSFHRNEILQQAAKGEEETMKITFKHTQPRKGGSGALKLGPPNAEVAASSVMSPSDIYSRFGQPEPQKAAQEGPKSILKVRMMRLFIPFC